MMDIKYNKIKNKKNKNNKYKIIMINCKKLLKNNNYL